MTSPGIYDFLLARIAEDEHFGTHDSHLAKRWDAECEAKRRIVLLANAARDDDDDLLDQVRVMTLRLLALPYADHPDYREEWKP